MPKGYWVAHADVSDAAASEAYRAANAAAFARFGGRFLVRGGTQEVVEGAARRRTVVIEFPSLAAARACWQSAAYAAARRLRAGIAEADVVIVEGVEPDAPG